MPRALTDAQFARLLQFRVALRRFNRWSEEQAAAEGLTHAQHQLLLVVRGHPESKGPTITEVAECLLLKHQSAIGLIKRTEALGLVARHSDPDDNRLVRIKLTAAGRERVHALTGAHLQEFRRLAEFLDAFVELVDD